MGELTAAFHGAERQRDNPSRWTAVSGGGMVATAHHLATAAGVSILERGGDAVDAAVAASLALGVCEPAGSGLGGMTMAVVHRADTEQSQTFAGACRAPELATPEALAGQARYRGYRAIAAPANPAVLDALHRKFGRVPLTEVAGPAIRIAEDGFPLSNLQRFLANRFRKQLRRRSGGSLFLAPDGNPLAAGTVLRQPALAQTLRRLAGAGFQDFYHGEIARLIAFDMERNGGYVRESDLATMEVIEGTPLETKFAGLTIHTIGPPAGGIALIEMLNLWNVAAGDHREIDTPEGAALLAEVIRQARADRRRFRLNTGANEPGAAAALLGREYAGDAAKKLRAKIGLGETSHISVADAAGNLVSMTQSIERVFGAAEVHPELGFLYNGFLRGFKTKNRRHPHFLRPGAVARSNAAPAIMLQRGQPWGAIGNTGSERLASGILQVLIRLQYQTPFEAVNAPRLHYSPDHLLMLEAERFSPEVVEALSHRAGQLQRMPRFAFQFGGLNLVCRAGDGFRGVSDPRRDGAAAGPETAPVGGQATICCSEAESTSVLPYLTRYFDNSICTNCERAGSSSCVRPIADRRPDDELDR